MAPKHLRSTPNRWATQTKASIVFAHGIWADGSCFQRLIPTLRAEGHDVMAAQHGLDTLKGEASTRPSAHSGESAVRSFLSATSYVAEPSSRTPVMDPCVSLLWSALRSGPDETETSQSEQEKFPKTDAFNRQYDVADGRVWLKPNGGVACFAGDLSARRAGRRLCDPLRASRRPVQPEAARYRLAVKTEPGIVAAEDRAATIPIWNASPQSAWAPRPSR